MRLLLLLIVIGVPCFAQTPLTRAHAHNDYEHTHPLADALAQGFGSIEADVYPIDGELLVAHDVGNVKPDRTLEKLYLAPIKERFDQNKGQVIPGLRTLILLIDIKTNGLLAYQTLEKQIEKYKSMLTEFADGKVKTNAVTIILSGDRPREYLTAQKQRWAALDGRLVDLSQNPSTALIPLVSDAWSAHFKWKTGPRPAEEATHLKEIISQAHQQGRLLRFWAVPDRVEAWAMLYDAGVDLINTDHLEELSAFLRSRVR